MHTHLKYHICYVLQSNAFCLLQFERKREITVGVGYCVNNYKSIMKENVVSIKYTFSLDYSARLAKVLVGRNG